MSNWDFDDAFIGGVYIGADLVDDEATITDRALYKFLIEQFLTPSPSSWTAAYESGAAIRANGSGITTDASGTVITGGTVDSLDFLDTDGTTVLVTLSFAPALATDVFNAIAADSQNTLFDFLTGLVDDDTTVTGTAEANGVFVGAGNDTATMGDGNDAIAKFSAGDLTYDGGDGSDTLSFKAEAGFGGAFPNPQVQQLVVNLTIGTGDNPFGGTLTLTSVENIAGLIGGFGGAQITGSDDDNFIGDRGLGGGTFESIIGATIDTLGGNDTIAFSNFSNSSADGGDGADTVAFESFGGTHTLDLTTQANNAGAFSGATFANFENYRLSVFQEGTLNFTGTDQADNLTIEGNSTFNIALGGGNDTLTTLDFTDPTFFNPSISANVDGGDGTDTLIFRQGVGTNVLDLANPANNTGPFTGRTFTGFETFRTLIQGGSNGILDFRGDANANDVHGSPGNDILRGNGGDDILDGNDGEDTAVYANDFSTYAIAENGTDIVITGAGEGTDTVRHTVEFFEFADVIVSRADLMAAIDPPMFTNGPDNVTLPFTGGTFNALGGSDIVRGGIGADVVFLGNGNDNVTGGDGNDRLLGQNGNDVLRGQGDADFLAGGNHNDRLFGDGGNDRLFGQNGNDFLVGGDGDDLLFGQNGRDRLIGGDGEDTLIGGRHRDVLAGGADRDVFDFNSIADSRKGPANRDIITDFQRGLDDIDLRTIDAKTGVAGNQKFKFIGKQDFHDKKGELHYKKAGPNVLVEGDVNGDGHADFQILVKGVGALNAGDFFF